MKTENQSLSKKEFFFKTIISPSIAAILDRLLLHPLDTIISFQQEYNLSYPQAIRHIVKEFGIRGFYKGLSPTLILSSIPVHLFMFGTYSACILLFKEKTSIASKTTMFFSSLCAGFASMSVYCPSETKRIRETFNITPPYPTYHPSVMFRGYVPLTIKGMTYAPIAIVGADILQSQLPQTTMTPFLSGLISGSIAQVFTTPLDVVKLKVMADKKYTKFSFFKHANTAYQNKELYNSLSTRLLRYGLNTALMIGTIDTLNHAYDSYSLKKSNN